MIYDTISYNGEADMLEIRLNILNDYVDQFIIVEADTTFSGKPKPLYYWLQRKRFEKWADKIKYFVIDENYTTEEMLEAENSPNTQGAEHWKREFLQKESIKKALTHLKDNDHLMIGDVDEIWQPGVTYWHDTTRVNKMHLRVYSYYLNNRSSEEFWGTISAPYALIKNECLNHLRTNSFKWQTIHGWHFTSMGGHKELERKLTDSYTQESYATPGVLSQLEYNVTNNKDFLGRDFTYTVDESEWPQFLKDNKEKYKHLLK